MTAGAVKSLIFRVQIRLPAAVCPEAVGSAVWVKSLKAIIVPEATMGLANAGEAVPDAVGCVRPLGTRSHGQ